MRNAVLRAVRAEMQADKSRSVGDRREMGISLGVRQLEQRDTCGTAARR